MKNVAILTLSIFFSTSAFSQNYEVEELISTLQSPNDSIRIYSLKDLVLLYTNRDIDSARMYLRSMDREVKAVNDDFYTALNHTLSGAFHEMTGNYDSSLIQLRKALVYNKKINRRTGEANNYSLMGNVFSSQRETDSAILYYEKAKSIYLEQNITEGLSAVTMNLGVLYFDLLGDYPKALSYYYEALDYSRQINNTHDMALVQLNIGNLLTIIERYPEAEVALKNSIALTHSIDDLGNLVIGHDLLAAIYSKTGPMDKVLENYEKSLEYSEKIGDPRLIFSSTNDLISTYSKLKNWNKSLELAKSSLIIISEVQFSATERAYNSISLHLQLTQCYYHLNKIKESKKHLKLAEAIQFPSQLNTAEVYNLYSEFSSVYEDLGDYKQSLHYFKLKTAYDDSINTVENQKTILKLQTQYQTEKKEQEISNLKQTATIQDLEITRKNNQILIGGLFLLLFAGGGFIYHRQYKIKKDKVAVELEQRFLRSQLNPHFIFNAIGAIQHYLLTESAESTSHYLSMFSTLMRQILENSRQEFIRLEEEIEMLKNYLSLQKLRFKDHFDYRIVVDEDLDEEYCGIPPMFAQPFIENSLEHGLFKKDGKNEIIIKFKKADNGLIQLEVIDSGIGIATKKESEHTSLATQITKERLERMKANHKLKVGIQSENVKDLSGIIEGYRIQLDLPSKLVAA